jgi:predicted transposase YdaD
MLNWEYDADAERRVIREEAQLEGRQEGRQKERQEIIEILTKLVEKGTPINDALEIIKNASVNV